MGLMRQLDGTARMNDNRYGGHERQAAGEAP